MIAPDGAGDVPIMGRRFGRGRLELGRGAHISSSSGLERMYSAYTHISGVKVDILITLLTSLGDLPGASAENLTHTYEVYAQYMR